MLWILIGSGLPALLLLVWCYKQDLEQPEPVKLLFKGVFLGIIGTIPVIILELASGMFTNIFPPIMREAYTAFFIAGFIEEGMKYVLLKNFFYKKSEFDQVMDGIVYAFCISLGFAFAENFLYGLQNSKVLLVRAFTAVPMHAFSTGIMGYWLGRQKFDAPDSKLGQKGFGIAVLIHGAYDFFIFVGMFYISLLVLFVSGRLLRQAIRSARNLDSDLDVHYNQILKSIEEKAQQEDESQF
ncbi:MAG TPA: PrsW family glutamic-type intramembrane protease [Spirochaetia bacterium]|nr:PrsW family glutamic-type intramembrane protease [Spirochaetales bacterium]HRS65846.1 PrsW family glutamic-type intramembrane protease [Spirochaetia bacterium]HOT58941.1 PrsW family glutamic-type intramembrane protease [Spirochaetales bacterium]HPD81167.1 PrsW family glutamic-type intramembrane protease [Spirochaetales bacterium]HQG39727.1 PrsW family glutamic-type intramembrane protease [Spirochaetales bacterium]